MLRNARDIDLTLVDGGSPNVNSLVTNWLQPMTFTLITRSIINFRTVEEKTVVETKAIIQPFTDEQLSITQFGERNWRWYKIYSDLSLIAKVKDRLVYKGIAYQIMAFKDYESYGYVEYNAIENIIDEA